MKSKLNEFNNSNDYNHKFNTINEIKSLYLKNKVHQRYWGFYYHTIAKFFNCCCQHQQHEVQQNLALELLYVYDIDVSKAVNGKFITNPDFYLHNPILDAFVMAIKNVYET